MEAKRDGMYLFGPKNPVCGCSPAAQYNSENRWLYFSYQYFNSVPSIGVATEMLEKLRHVRHHELISTVTQTGSQEHHRVNQGASSDR